MKRRVTRADLLDLTVAFGCIAFLVALGSLVPLWLQLAYVTVCAVVIMIRCDPRRKMDSHRRDDRSGSDQPVGLGSHGERGAEIDFPRVERF